LEAESGSRYLHDVDEIKREIEGSKVFPGKDLARVRITPKGAETENGIYNIELYSPQLARWAEALKAHFERENVPITVVIKRLYMEHEKER
jgi:hypothetical protein